MLFSSCSDKKSAATGNDDTDKFESVITGSVVDKAGNPVSNVIITSQISGTSVSTDASGSFTLSDLSATTHQISVQKEDWVDTTISITLGLSERKVLPTPITLKYQYATLQGNVLKDGAFSAFSGVTIKDHNISVIADASGKYLVGRIPAGTYEVFAMNANEGFGVKTITFVADSVYSVDLTIDQFGGTVLGQVVDATGAKVNGAVVSLFGNPVDTTNTIGFFEINHIPANEEISIVVRKGTMNITLSGIKVYEYGEYNIGEVVLKQKGTVVDPNAPIDMGDVEYGFTQGAVDSIALVASYDLIDSSYDIVSYMWYYAGQTAVTLIPNIKLPTTLWPSVGVDTAWVVASLTKISSELIGDTLLYDTLNTVSDSGMVLINMTQANSIPQFTLQPSDTTLIVGETYTFTLQAADADNEPIEFRLTQGDERGVALNNKTVSFTATKVDSFVIAVSVSDSSGVSSPANWSVKVRELLSTDTLITRDTVATTILDTAVIIDTTVATSGSIVTTSVLEYRVDSLSITRTFVLNSAVINSDVVLEVLLDTTILSKVSDVLGRVEPPANITFTPGTLTAPSGVITVNLAGYPDTLIMAHLEIIGATIDAAALVTADENVRVLNNGSSCDILVFPGGTGFSGDMQLVTLTLSGLVAGTNVAAVELTGHTVDGKTVSVQNLPVLTVN